MIKLYRFEWFRRLFGGYFYIDSIGATQRPAFKCTERDAILANTHVGWCFYRYPGKGQKPRLSVRAGTQP